MPELKERVRALAERTIETRRDLHRHPETAFEEVRTMGVITERLRALGLEPRDGVGGTGVVAVWDSGRPGPTVLARADMDALPVPDEKSAPYRSGVDGANHACGHDGHVSALLSVAEVLLQDPEALRGRIVFLFQPAEEIVQGAEAMLADGALDGLEIDRVLGLHLGTMHPTGTVALREGPAMAAADRFLLRVRGQGGHAAMPHQTVDPIVISAQLISALQTLVSRETDPVDPAVVSLTKIHGGTAFNIVPEAVEIGGTLRTFADATRTRLEARIREVAEGVARTHHGEVDVDWIAGSPAVVNDDAATARMRAVAERIVGQGRVVRPDPIMGGDDMALWLRQAPGCYFFVGARGGEASAWPHHHPRFDLDEAALEVAVRVFAEGIVDALEG